MDFCLAVQRVVSGVSTPRLAEEEGRPAHAGRDAHWCTSKYTLPCNMPLHEVNAELSSAKCLMGKYR